MDLKPKRIVLIASLVIYNLAWFLPALTFHHTSQQSQQTWLGAQCALTVWTSWAYFHFEPYANFVYFIALIQFPKKYLGSLVFSGIALALSLQTLDLFVEPIALGLWHKDYRLLRLEIGFYLWFLSFFIIFIFSLFKTIKPDK
jgi:hypothetical protein